MNIAKEEYKGHIIHMNTPIDFQFYFSGLHDRKINQRLFTDNGSYSR
jgi:hypothetical protein